MRMLQRKHQGWGNFLKKHRELHFRSAREFCSKLPVGASYPQYSRYEAGEQLPSIEQALALCQLLGIPPLEGLVEWSRAQISDPTILKDLDALLSQLQGAKKSAPVTGEVLPGAQIRSRVPLDEVIVFNRAHLKLFATDPSYRDIFTYVNSFGPEWISPAEISEALGIPFARTQKMLEKLRDLGVIVFQSGKYAASKKNFYFPDDQDFFDLRNSNLQHNASSIISKLNHEDLAAKKAYRGLITRELTQTQLNHLIASLDEVLGSVVSFPETSKPETIYSLCVLLGARFSRKRAEFSQTSL